MGWNDAETLAGLVGQTLVEVRVLDDEIYFVTEEKEYKMYHENDCCESVYVEDICGDIEDLIGSPVLVAVEVTSHDIDPYVDGPYGNNGIDNDIDYMQDKITGKDYFGYTPESFTWTFYKIDTAKGGVTIRWLGESNGYYSESVDFVEL